MSEDNKMLDELKTMLFNYVKKITERKATSGIEIELLPEIARILIELLRN